MRQVRLTSGLLLLTFVVMHLALLVLGLASVEAMNGARAALLIPWQTVPGQALLLAAALVHAILGLASLAARRTLRMSNAVRVQLVTGLAIPPLLAIHVIALQVVQDIDPAFTPGYGFALALYWRFAPAYALLQLSVILAVYLHGAIGLGAWLKLRPWWPRVSPIVIPLAFALPILALLGFAEAGEAVLGRLDHDPAWAAGVEALLQRLAPMQDRVGDITRWVLIGYGAAVAAAVACPAVRMAIGRRIPVAVRFEDGTVVRGFRGLSILEAGHGGAAFQAQACDGRGRCGACAVLPAPDAALSPLGDFERRTLKRTGAPPGARLACEARLLDADVVVRRLEPVFPDIEEEGDDSDGSDVLGEAVE